MDGQRRNVNQGIFPVDHVRSLRGAAQATEPMSHRSYPNPILLFSVLVACAFAISCSGNRESKSDIKEKDAGIGSSSNEKYKSSSSEEKKNPAKTGATVDVGSDGGKENRYPATGAKEAVTVQSPGSGSVPVEKQNATLISAVPTPNPTSTPAPSNSMATRFELYADGVRIEISEGVSLTSALTGWKKASS